MNENKKYKKRINDSDLIESLRNSVDIDIFKNRNIENIENNNFLVESNNSIIKINEIINPNSEINNIENIIVDPLKFIENFKSDKPIDKNYYKQKYGTKFFNNKKPNEENNLNNNQIEQYIHDSYNSLSDIKETKQMNKEINSIISKYNNKKKFFNDSENNDTSSISIENNLIDENLKNKSVPSKKTPNISSMMKKYKKENLDEIKKDLNKNNNLKETLKFPMDSKSIVNKSTKPDVKNKFLKKNQKTKPKRIATPDTKLKSNKKKNVKKDIKNLKKFSQNLSKKPFFKNKES